MNKAFRPGVDKQPANDGTEFPMWARLIHDALAVDAIQTIWADLCLNQKPMKNARSNAWNSIYYNESGCKKIW